MSLSITFHRLDECRLRHLSLYKCTLDDIVAGFADVVRNAETARVQHRTGIVEHLGTTADHNPIIAWIESGQVQVPEKFAGFDQGRQAAMVGMRFARYRRVVVEFLAHRITED